MAYTEPVDRALAELITPPIWNAEVAANFRAMGPHLIARKASDQNVTSTTYANDNTLATPSIPANEVWRFSLFLRVTTGAGGFKTSFSIPTSSELLATWYGDTSVAQIRLIASDGAEFSGYISNNTNGRLYVIEALFINAGTAGAVTLRVGLASASGTSVSKAQSTLWGVKLA